jgi:hypothetical protein
VKYRERGVSIPLALLASLSKIHFPPDWCGQVALHFPHNLTVGERQTSQLQIFKSGGTVFDPQKPHYLRVEVYLD